MATRVHWTGAFFSNSSLALVNRELVGALADRPDVEVSIEAIDSGAELSWDSDRVRQLRGLEVGGQGPVDVSVFHRWPLDPHPPRSGKWVIFQPWEFGVLPRAWYEPMKFGADEVWVYSSFNKQSYVESGIPEEKIRVVPLGVHPGLLAHSPGPFPLRTSKRFKFLFVGGTILRKGIDILLDAYIRTFTRADDVCLVIKDMGVGTFYRNQTHEEFIRELQSDPRLPEIEYLTDDLTTEQLGDLYHSCDCLVHPFRGEGFGLPVAEAMACGLPVIVPDYGGAADFCTPETALLVPGRRVPIPEALCRGMDTLGTPWWVEVQSGDLQAQMRATFENPENARTLGRRARCQAERMSWKATAIVATEGLHALNGGNGDNPRLVDDPARLGDLHVAEGIAHWEQREIMQAIRHFGAAESLHPSSDLLYNNAFVLYAAGDFRTALGYLARLLDRAGEGVDGEARADAELLRAHCHRSLEDRMAAQCAVERALLASPEHADAAALLTELRAQPASKSVSCAAGERRIRWRGWIFNASGYAEETRSFLTSVLRRENWRIRIDAADEVVNRGILSAPDFQRLARLTETPLDRVDVDFQHIPPTYLQPCGAPISVVRTMFETDRIPEQWVDACNRLTEVWVPTRFNRETFARAGVLGEKLRVMPGSLDTTKYDPACIPSERRADRFRFLSVFDFQPRKGWDVLLHAYFQEFHVGEPVSLVIKVTSHHGGDATGIIQNFAHRHGYRNGAEIEVIAEDLSESQMLSLYAGVDAFVLPSRGEGWGRPFMEAMALELPTIGTGWSGNTEFMNDGNSYLVEVEALEPCEWTWPEMSLFRGHLWARPSIESTRALMRRVLEDSDDRKKKGAQARKDIVSAFDQSLVGCALTREFDRLLSLL